MKSKSKLIIIPTITLAILLVYTGKLSINCPIHYITGLYCPGCGITRCLLAILKLNFYQAFRYNPLVFVSLPFFLIYYIYKLYLFICGKNEDITKKIPNYVYYLLLIITIVFGIMRNMDAFIWLAPTKI